MKKGFVWAGVLAVSMVASGVTAYTVTKAADKDSYTPAESFASNVGTHFTAYEEGGYPDLTYAAENAVKGVVNIVNTQEISSRAGYRGGYGDDGGFEQFFRQQPEQQPRPQERKSGGSGVIISPDGYIVTNHHVVDNASKLKVTLNDKRTFDAKVIGTDPTTEVALIKIDANDLPTIPIGNSDALRLGECWPSAARTDCRIRSRPGSSAPRGVACRRCRRSTASNRSSRPTRPSIRATAEARW